MIFFALEPNMIPSKPNNIDDIDKGSNGDNLALRIPRTITNVPISSLKIKPAIDSARKPTPNINGKRTFQEQML